MDIFVFLILSFVVVIFFVVFKFASATISSEMLAQASNLQKSFGIENTTNVTAIITNTIGKIDESFNHLKWISIAFIFTFTLSILISAFLVRTHPAFFVAYVLLVVIAIIMSVYLSNSYQTLSATPILMPTFLSFTGAHYIMYYLPIWVTVIGMLAGVLMYINLNEGGYY